MNRRKFLAAMAAGAIVTAEGLWIPGQKLISIPKKIEWKTYGYATKFFDYDCTWSDGLVSNIKWWIKYNPRTGLIIDKGYGPFDTVIDATHIQQVHAPLIPSSGTSAHI
jgi:hypothetical protein